MKPKTYRPGDWLPYNMDVMLGFVAGKYPAKVGTIDLALVRFGDKPLVVCFREHQPKRKP